MIVGIGREIHEWNIFWCKRLEKKLFPLKNITCTVFASPHEIGILFNAIAINMMQK